MFSKEDYYEYFEVIEEREKAMIFIAKRIKDKADDPKIIDAANRILLEEAEHYKLARKLFEFLARGKLEERGAERRPVIGEVRIKECATNAETFATYSDISETGIEVLVGKRLSVGDTLELAIVVEEGKDYSHRFGTVVWVKRIENNPERKFSAGIKFTA